MKMLEKEIVPPVLSPLELKGFYHWSTYWSEDPRISGPLDDTPFNRKEGYEVYYLLTTLAKTRKEALAYQELLPQVPIELKTQKDVGEWILGIDKK